MAFTSNGYPGPYPQQDDHYGGHSYAANPAPSLVHPSLSGPPMVYPQVDMAQPQALHGTAYHETPVAAGYPDHTLWQPPQAPRLSAAAARAGRMQSLVYGAFGYPQAHVQTPWYPQLMQFPPQQQQPRTHQQLEHQLLMQQQMAKAQDQQYQPAIYSTAPAHVQHHHRHLSSHAQSASMARQDNAVWMHSHDSANYASFGRSRSQTHQDSWGQSSIGPGETARACRAARDWHEQSATWPEWQPYHRASVPQGHGHNHQHIHHQHRFSDDATARSHDAYRSDDRFGQDWRHQQQQQLHQRHYPQYSQHMNQNQQPHGQAGATGVNVDPISGQYCTTDVAQASQVPVQPVPTIQQQADMWAAQQQSLVYAQMASIGNAAGHNVRYPLDSDIWQPRPETRRPELAEDILPAGERATKPDDASAADQDQGPAPPSPDTLDKSAVPIAAIGAQIIWTVCTALFDPELLTEAHGVADETMDEDVDDMSTAPASAPSTSSTPSLNTPDISPWSSTVLDATASDPATGEWNSFRSPFGPERVKHIRANTGSVHLGSETSLGTDLHRMAVGAERAKIALARNSSPRRSRQVSVGHLDFATGHSSGASTASSSEPGTPASLPRGSPTLSSAISARSVETMRSSTGTGLETSGRSRSDSAVRSRRSSCKTSPTMASTRWSSRIKSNVLAVLRLISPEWRWSNNDDELVSLVASPPPSVEVPQKSTPLQNNGRPGRDSVVGIITSYANEPSPAFRRFAHQVLAQTLLSPTAFLLGVLNALRLPMMARLPNGSIDPTFLDLFAQPTSAAPFKLFAVGMMIANKHLDDNTFLNKTWNEVTGIPLVELNQIEAWFLKKCNYEITVPDGTWVGFLHRVQIWEETRSSQGTHRDQDSSKRLLLILDEALGHFDAIPNFRLDEAKVNSEHGPMAFSGSLKPTLMDIWDDQERYSPQVASFSSRDRHWRPAPDTSTLTSGSLNSGSDDVQNALRSSHASRNSFAQAEPASLCRSSSDCAVSSSSKTISPVSDSGKSLNGSMSGPLMPSSLLNGSRSLLQTNSCGPLAASAWAHA